MALSISFRKVLAFALLILVTNHVTKAFVTPRCSQLSAMTTTEGSSTTLHGVKIDLRRRPTSFFKSRGVSFSSTSSVSEASLDEDDEVEIPRAYTLPPRDDKALSRLEQEFRGMMADFSKYTPADIALVRNQRLRPLYEGVAAGAQEPAVYRAFEVLFEDYVPIRIAGRMIYGKLKSVINNELKKRDAEHDKIASSTGLSPQEIQKSRQAFLAIADNQSDGQAYLTVEELVDTGIAVTAVELMGYADFDDFLAQLDHDQTGQLTFEKLMVGLQRCAKDSCAAECKVGSVLPEIAKRMEPRECETEVARNARHQKYSDRYDKMVQSFIEWEDAVPTGDGRRLDVLRGCFVGARNEKVIEALRIVYIDYSALRVAGDLIFKIMAKIVKASRNKKT